MTEESKRRFLAPSSNQHQRSISRYFGHRFPEDRQVSARKRHGTKYKMASCPVHESLSLILFSETSMQILLKAFILSFLASVAISHFAVAQPTGNPKGSVAPASSDAPKSSAEGGKRASAGSTDTGKLYTDKGPADARAQTNSSPGTGNAGGLPKRTPQEGRTSPGPIGGSQNRPAPQ